MTSRHFSPGFRLSWTDGAVLVCGVSAALFAPKPFSIIAGTAVGHFFLFCNVFRISRTPELIWATCYVALATATLASGHPGWLASTLIAVGLAAALIGLEMRKPSYHGIGWRKINPGLRQWWETQSQPLS